MAADLMQEEVHSGKRARENVAAREKKLARSQSSGNLITEVHPFTIHLEGIPRPHPHSRESNYTGGEYQEASFYELPFTVP